MNPDIREMVPDFDGVQDAVTSTGLAVVAIIPALGSLVSDLTQGAVARRAAKRQHEFDVAAARAIHELQGRRAELAVGEILDSDEFVASYAKAARAAAETDSAAKRARLARVLSHMGPWDDLEKARRQQLLDLVVKYDDIHVLLLQFFADPAVWLSKYAEGWSRGKVITSGISNLLTGYVFPGVPDWQSIATPVLGAFAADGVAVVPLNGTMTEQGTLQSRTTRLGDQLLAFLAEP